VPERLTLLREELGNQRAFRTNDKPSGVPGFLFDPQSRKEVKRMYTSITVGQVLRAKGYGFHAISSDATAYSALELMADKNIGALMVMENDKLVGVFSERDYARNGNL